MKILFTAVGSIGYPSLIKEFQNAGIEIIGIDADPHAIGFSLLEKSYVVPLGTSNSFIPKILEIIELEKLDAIISNPEEELLILSKNKDTIEEKGTLLLCPDFKTVELCAYKKKTYDFLESIGIPIPKNYSKETPKFPCVVKPNFGRGGSSVYYVNNQKELEVCLNKVNNPIIQEFIHGEEYSIDILADKEGISLSVIPRVRLKTESGISTRGITIYNEKIINYCKKIVKELKIFGPSCIQCIKSGENIKFLEVNTRFGGGSILSIRADQNIIPNLMKLINNEKPIVSKNFLENLTMNRFYSEVFNSKEKIIKNDK